MISKLIGNALFGASWMNVLEDVLSITCLGLFVELNCRLQALGDRIFEEIVNPGAKEVLPFKSFIALA